MSSFNLVFDGTISDGYQVEDVKRNLANLFKVDAEKVDRLFLNKPVVLKKDLDHDSAVKYQKVLLKAGAVSRVKSFEKLPTSQTIEKAAPASTSVQALKQAVPPPISKQSGNSVIDGAANLGSEHAEEKSSEKKSGNGIGDIVAGVILIGIGFAIGGSVFLGNPGILDFIFDGLGIFWIGRGIYKMVR